MALLLENEEQEITKYREETLYIHEISLISNIFALVLMIMYHLWLCFFSCCLYYMVCLS